MAETLAGSERRTLSDEAYTELKSRILRSVLVPGAKLSIDGLAKQLEFSQTPIREALARLESEGLLARRPLSGYTVAPLLTAEEFEDLFEIRMLLEPLAARRAAERGPDSDAEASLREASLTHTGGDSPSDQLAFTEADQSFHNEVARLSGSGQLFRAIRRLDAHLHLHRAYIEPEAIEETEAEHRAIAAAIIGLKPLAAEEAMRRHLERSRERHAAAFRS